MLKYGNLLFRISYLVHLFVSFNTYLNTGRAPSFSLTLLFVGALLAVPSNLKQIFENYKHKNLNSILATVFIVSYVISSLLTYKYGITENIKCLIWMGFQLIFLFVCAPKNEKEFVLTSKIIFSLTIIYFTFTCLVGFYLMQSNTHVFKHALDGSIQFYGFWFGRLYGLFNDPNHAAVLSVITFVLCLWGFKQTSSKLLKACLSLAALVQVLFIAFTDSRTGLLSLVVGAVIYIIFTALLNKTKWYKAILCLVVVSGGLLYSNTAIKTGYNAYLEWRRDGNIVDSSQTSEDDNVIEDTPSEDISIGREEDISSDISNRRFSIWKSGLEIFKESPIFGVSYKNIVNYAQDNTPNTYLVSNDYKVFDSCHNSFIDILVAQGIVGMLITATLGIYTLWNLVRNWQVIQTTNAKNYLPVIIAMIGCILFSSCLISNIVYINSVESYYFWLSLGLLNSCLYVFKKEGENSYEN